MVEMRPRQYPVAKAPLTTDQKVGKLERTTAAQADQLAEQGAVIIDHGGSIADLSIAVAEQGVIVVDHGESIDALTVAVADQGDAIDMLVTMVDGLPPPATLWTDDRPDAGFGAGSELTWTAIGNGVAVTFNIPGRLSTNPARYVVIVGGVRQAPASFSLSSSAATLTFTEAPPAGVAISIHAPFYGSAP